jgi:hypothetical protein
MDLGRPDLDEGVTTLLASSADQHCWGILTREHGPVYRDGDDQVAEVGRRQADVFDEQDSSHG